MIDLRTIQSLFVAALCLFFFLACSADERLPVEEFDVGNDVEEADADDEEVSCESVTCEQDELCYRGVCYETCVDSTDCALDARCFENACRPLDCEGVKCLSQETCYRGVCYDSCTEEDDCDSDMQCHEHSCLPTGCDAVECMENEYCFRGVCYAFCTANEDCEGQICIERQCVDVPGPPGAVDCTAGEGEVVLSWEPAATQTIAIVEHRVTVYDAEGNAPQGVAGPDSRQSDTADTSFVFTGLTNGIAYRFGVEAANAAGWGPSSALSASCTPLGPAGPPLMGTTVHRADELILEFEAPGETGGAPITAFEYSTDGGDTWKAREDASTSSPMVITTVSGASAPLSPGVSYDVALRAVTAYGPGTRSDVWRLGTCAAQMSAGTSSFLRQGEYAYCYHQVNGAAVTTNATITFAATTTASVLVVGGGGGGGAAGGGGGGAGEYRYWAAMPINAGAYNVRAGRGGPGSTSGTVEGSKGADSFFGAHVSRGGGPGFSRNGGASPWISVCVDNPGGDATPNIHCGSGGGGSNAAGVEWQLLRGVGQDGSSTGSATAGGSRRNQGGNGCSTVHDPPEDCGNDAGGGGGGGASTAGTLGFVYAPPWGWLKVGGDGGVGIENDISGTAICYAGGGGGGATGSGDRGVGSCGGGHGRQSGQAATPGSDGLGSGGGGGGAAGARGGGGTVRIRYPVDNYLLSPAP